MEPIIDSDWLGCKNEAVEDSQHVGNVARSWQWREMGINPSQYPTNKTVMENMAEDILVQKELKIRSCDLPGYPRSTFLMVFSPDGTKVASTHGNHNVYVSELASGRHVRILQGHPRTPWCIAFHPARAQLIGSGCLGGQVRVWDLSGGSETWTVRAETVVASIAFHPRDQLLVIATSNELYFWDWSQPAPAIRVCTNNINEKVRYVAFDSLGFKLITGITVWGAAAGAAFSLVAHGAAPAPAAPRRAPPADPPPPGRPGAEGAGSTQEMIVNSYQSLVQRYDSLVRNYQRLFMARTQLTTTNTTTTDRGTDPMETDAETPARPAAPAASTSRDSSTSRRTEGRPGADSGDGEPGGGRLLNLDVLTIHGSSSRSVESGQPSASSAERSTFGSRSSAFQRLSDSLERAAPELSRAAPELSRAAPELLSRAAPELSRAEPSRGELRWLPNPFSSPEPGSSRTRLYTAPRRRPPPAHAPGPACACATCACRRRPPTAECGTQAPGASVHASLELIRDILRDSGTRLLDLITTMSLSTLAGAGLRRRRARPRRGRDLLSTEDEDEGAAAEPADTLAEALRRVAGAERAEPGEPAPADPGGGGEGAAGEGAGDEDPAAAAAAYRAVRLAVGAMHRHTAHLTGVWLGGGRASMHQLRRVWEDLRRRVRALQRQAAAGGAAPAPAPVPAGSPPATASYYSRPLLERCRLLSAGGRAAPPPPRCRPALAPRRARPGPRSLRAMRLHCTRNEVRLRAMQVLSALFDMMLGCLRAPGLADLIVQMLRTLKKALALTCLMLMKNRLAAAGGGGAAPGAGGAGTGDADSTSSWPTSDSDAPASAPAPAPAPAAPAPPRYSERLAVQIAAANRNTSTLARTRRDLYRALERQRALHRTDPARHPAARRRPGPPALPHRIPVLRRAPPRARPGPAPAPRPAGARDSLLDFEHRVNMYRIAHMHAVQLRSAARTRLRRLQAIRLYTAAAEPGEPPRRPHILARTEPGRAAVQFDQLLNNVALQYRPLAREPAAPPPPRGQFDSILNNVAVPLVQVNDLPFSEGPAARAREVHGYLQPIILAQNALLIDGSGGLLEADSLPAPTHRVQAWDFTQGGTPDIADSKKNVVVQRCRIHNDASIDISKDGRLLVALLPVPRLRNTNHWLGVYSLEWGRLGCCLHTAALEQSAVSVALSPTARHLAVGLGSRRVTTLPHARNNVFALLYRLQPHENSSRPSLTPIKELEQNWEQGFTSLNCLRWAPQPGQGLVYANNTGQLIVMS